ncbi:MAG: lipopolysaccharide biosynthesis protein [Thiotrichales bacterium]
MSKVIFAISLRGLSAVAIFLLYAYISNVLDLASAGKFFALHTALIVLTPLLVMGMHTIALREVSANTDSSDRQRQAIWSTLKRAIGTSAILTSATCFLTIAIIYTLAIDWPLEIVGFFFFISFISSISLTLGNQLQGMRRFNIALVVLNLSVPVTTILAAYLFNIASLEGAMGALGAAVFITAAIAVAAVAPHAMKTSRNEDYSPGFDFTSLFSLTVIFLAVQSVNWSGVLLGGLFMPPEDIAKLSVILRTANIINFILIVANFLVSPCIASLWSKGKTEDLERFVQTTTLLLLAPLLVVTTTILVFSQQILAIFGEEYVASSQLLTIVMVGQFINVATGTVNALLTMSSNERSLMFAVVASGATSIIGVLLVAPAFGLAGVAYVIAGSLILQNFIAVVLVKRKLGFWIYKINFSVYSPSVFRKFMRICERKA